jgi:hypothetical protein
MSTTPRTDRQAGWAIANQYGRSTSTELLVDPKGVFVHAVFARTIETELAAMTARAEKAEAELVQLRAENDEMRVQIEANKRKGGGCQCADDEACAHVRRAEKAEAKLEDVAALLRRVSRHLPQDNTLRKQVIDYLKDRKLTGKILRVEKEASK